MDAASWRLVFGGLGRPPGGISIQTVVRGDGNPTADVDDENSIRGLGVIAYRPNPIGGAD